MRKSSRILRIRKKYGDLIADELEKEGSISWESWAKTGFCLRSKKTLVRILCVSCKTMSIENTKAKGKRVYKTQTCRNCALKMATSSEEWRTKNSISQKLIQSTADQKLKNAIGVSRSWTPERKTRAAALTKLRHSDPIFAERWMGASAKAQKVALCGEYLFRGSWIDFGSGYELSFLVWAEGNLTIQEIRRCAFSIPYKLVDGSCHRYFPDFLLLTESEKVLVEIKSIKTRHYNKEKQEQKEKAVAELVESKVFSRYELISEEHPLAGEIKFRASGRIRYLCKILAKQNKLRLRSKKHYISDTPG